MEGERKPWLLYLSRKVVTTQTFCNMSDPTKSYSLDIPKGTLGLGVRLRPRTVQHGLPDIAHLIPWQNTNHVYPIFVRPRKL
jgi:hypothetical protein